MRRAARWASVALWVAVAAGCRTTAPAAAPAEVVRDYAERVRDRIDAARAEPHVLVRHNPAPCGCPPFEVMLGGFWHRVAFDVSDATDPVVVALSEAVAAAGEGSVSVWRVAGRLDDALSTCGRGALVVSLRPVELVP